MKQVRDLLGFPLVNPLSLAASLKHVAPILAMYPEMMHRMVGVNTPAAVVRFIRFVQPAMRKLFKTWFPEKVDDAQMDRNEGKFLPTRTGDWSWVAKGGVGAWSRNDL